METYPADHLQHLQVALDEALQGAPYYSRWKSRDANPGAPILERLRALPTLSRKDLRLAFPKGLTPAGRDLKQAIDDGEVEIVATSGTTDDRVQVLWWQPWWDKQEEEQYRTGHALSRAIWEHQFKEAVLTTPVCSAGVCHIGDAPMQERTLGRMLFLNQKTDPIHWSERDLQRMVDELAQFAPEALEADPAYLAALGRYAFRKGLKLHRPKYIGLTYEFISRTHLRAIRAAFGDAPILNSYGSTEAGCLHLSCERGRLHPNLHFTHVDLIPVQARHGGPQLGRLVASVLQNPWLKLLRYETGDLATRADDPCACGRPGESLLRIDGRLKDVTFALDGSLRTVEAVDAAVGDLPGLEEYQVVQEGADSYFAKYVLEAEADEAGLRTALSEAVRRLYGGGTVTLQKEAAIAPEPSGKYRLAKSEKAFDPLSVF